MDETINLNHNSAYCIQSASHFGYTIYQNICTGVISKVDWGGVDWALCVMGLAAITLILLMFLCIGLMMLSNI